jgi:hypothetical protein
MVSSRFDSHSKEEASTLEVAGEEGRASTLEVAGEEGKGAVRTER